MRPILLEIGPLPAWAFVVAAVALFGAMALASMRDARKAGESPLGMLLLYALVCAGAIAAILHFREALAQPIPVRAYGTMLMLAFLAGIAWASGQAQRRGVQSAQILDLSFFLIIGSVVLARVLYVLLELDSYKSSPDAAYRVWEGGLSFHGGLLGAVLALAIFAHIRKLGFLQLADILAPAAALGYGIARIGCFLNGCCYGVPTSLPWGVRFIGQELPRHPTQVYSALASFAIFGLLVLWQRRPLRRGQLLMAYLALYSIYRFGIEFLRREATARVSLLGLTEAQIASIMILLLAVALYALMPGKAIAPETEIESVEAPAER